MLMRWNRSAAPRRAVDAPRDALTQLRRDMDSLFRDFDRSRAMLPTGPNRVVPHVELSDDGDVLHARMDLPGFAEDDIRVDLDRRTITIRGERNTDVPEGYSVHRRERGALSFAHAVTLPCRVDGAAVSATLTDGVLELRLPKAPEEQPRTIPIRSMN